MKEVILLEAWKRHLISKAQGILKETWNNSDAWSIKQHHSICAVVNFVWWQHRVSKLHPLFINSSLFDGKGWYWNIENAQPSLLLAAYISFLSTSVTKFTLLLLLVLPVLLKCKPLKVPKAYWNLVIERSKINWKSL